MCGPPLISLTAKLQLKNNCTSVKFLKSGNFKNKPTLDNLQTCTNLSDDQIASAQVGQALTLFKKEQTQTLRMLPDII